jgi:hypothetical protein
MEKRKYYLVITFGIQQLPYLKICQTAFLKKEPRLKSQKQKTGTDQKSVPVLF